MVWAVQLRGLFSLYRKPSVGMVARRLVRLSGLAELLLAGMEPGLPKPGAAGGLGWDGALLRGRWPGWNPAFRDPALLERGWNGALL